MERNSKGYPIYKDSKNIVHLYYAKKKLNRSLSSNEEVHHIDGDKDNFNPTNLLVLSREDHLNLEREIRIWKNLDIGSTLITFLSLIFFILYSIMQNTFLLTSISLLLVVALLMRFFPEKLRKFLFWYGLLKKHPNPS